MGKSKGGKKGKGKSAYKLSSGRSKKRRARQRIARCMMKVSRWERYQKEIKTGKRKGDLKRWDTAGLLRHITFLEKTA